jgi:hypothetical protein
MITRELAEKFSTQWIEAWNSHDLYRTLSHYSDYFEMSSPYIAQIAGEPSGTLQGKAAVGAYWAKALERTPTLRFELIQTLAGVDSVTIYYRVREAWPPRCSSLGPTGWWSRRVPTTCEDAVVAHRQVLELASAWIQLCVRCASSSNAAERASTMILQKLLGIDLLIIRPRWRSCRTAASPLRSPTPAASARSPHLGTDALRKELAAIRAATTKPFNVNFFCHTQPEPESEREMAWRALLAPYFAEYGIAADAIPAGPGRVPFNADAADVLAEFAPPVVSFHFGLPSPELLARVRHWGAKVLSSATTVEEARWLEARGVDAVIAQGLEAGGHRGIFLSEDLGTQVGTFALVPQIVQAVKIPVTPRVASRARTAWRRRWRSARPACRSGRPTCSVPKPRRARCIVRRSRATRAARRRSRTSSPEVPHAAS